jgi:hypothetical protein
MYTFVATQGNSGFFKLLLSGELGKNEGNGGGEAEQRLHPEAAGSRGMQTPRDPATRHGKPVIAGLKQHARRAYPGRAVRLRMRWSDDA